MGVDLGIEGNFFEQHRRFCHSIAGTQEVFEKLSILFQEDKQYFLVWVLKTQTRANWGGKRKIMTMAYYSEI